MSDEDSGSEDDEPVKRASSKKKEYKEASTEDESGESSDSDVDFQHQKPPTKATPSKEG